ncbi:MAG: ABC transporter permease subunit [Finegoldia sp.]|nr:ABC transporter permease subunit [Finegoldia sp.]
MKNKKKIFAVFICMLLVLTGFGKSYAKGETSSVVNDGVIDLGTSADFPPYEYYEGDKIVGIDVDIMAAISEYLGYEVKFHDMEFNNIIASIESNKLDGGMSGFTVTEERKKSVNFTEPYAKSEQRVLLKKDSEIKTLDDIRGKTIGTQLGTTGDMFARDDFGEENVQAFSKYSDAVLALQNGKLDCIILDDQTAVKFADANADLTLLDAPYAEEDYAIAVNKGNEALLNDFNEAIKALKADGTIDTIIAKYTQSDEEEGKQYSGIIGKIQNNLINGKNYTYLLEGLKTTIIVTIFALIIGLVLGILIAIIRTSAKELDPSLKSAKGFFLKFIDKLAGLFVTIIRGTPTTIQLLILFNVFLVNLDNLRLVAIIAFGLNSAAYMSELFRGGLQAVDKGEKEAARSLGLSYWQTLKKVVLPQGFKFSLPALGNEVITLFKETSISGFIGLVDLTRGASIIISKTFQAAIPYFAAALIYLVIVLVLEQIFKKLERNYDYA